MRIAMLAPLLGVEATGQSRAAAATAGRLAATGASVTVLGTDCGYRGRPVAHFVEMSPQVALRLFPSIGRLNRRLYRSVALLDWLAEHIDDFDVLEVQGIWSWSGMAAARLFRRHGKPYVLTPHGTMTRYDWRKSGQRRRLFWWIFGTVWRHADAVRFTSAGEETMSFYPPQGRSVVIPNGTELAEVPANDLRSAARLRLGIPNDAEVLLFLGRIVHQKGVKEAVAAFEIAAQSLPRLRLYLIGSADGKYGADVTASVQGSPVRERIVMPGAVFAHSGDGSKEDYYLAADAFIALSHNEGLSIALLEALAHSLPVIVTPGANLARVEECGAGVLTRHDAPSAANAIVALLQNAEARQSAGRQARRLVEETFSWERVVPQLLALYSELIAARKAGGA